MQLPRRTFLRLAAGAAVVPVVFSDARAQVYPSRPITIVVPFPPGGPTDLLGRLAGERIRLSFGQPVVIENVPGANGSLGVGRVARAAPDGHTLVVGLWNTHVSNAAPVTASICTDKERLSTGLRGCTLGRRRELALGRKTGEVTHCHRGSLVPAALER